jgi:hypothetical protein
MYPKIYNRDGQLLAVLNNIVKDSASIRRVINGEFTFTFEAHEAELKSEYFDTDNVVVIDGQSFDIKYYELIHNRDIKYKIQCEHVNYRLEDGEENTYEMYTNTGTPEFILADILSGTGFSVGIVDFEEAITITSGESEVTKKTLIYELANLLGGEVEYGNDGFTINILNSIGQDNGFQARFGRNLLGVTKFVDKRGELTVSYELDIVELKNSNEYIEQQLQDLDVIEVGDTIRIVDDVIGLDIVNRIVVREYNPITTINTKLEIANKIETIIDTLISIQTTTVKMDTLYNNVSISNSYGFKAERSDKKAKIEMNATEGLSVFTRADPEGLYSKNLWIDANGNIVLNGVINLLADSDATLLGLKALAYEDNVDWDTQIMHIPNTLKAPAGSGLFLSSTHMGFHDEVNGWRTYMDADGNFYLGGVAGKLQWNANTNELYISGNITMEGGSINWENVTPPDMPAGYTDEEAIAAISGTYIDEFNVWTVNVYAQNIVAGFLELVEGMKIGTLDQTVEIDKDGIRLKNGKISIEGANTETVIDQYGINPKFLDYSKNLVWNSSFEVHDADNKPFYWAITGDGDCNTGSSFWGNRSLRLGANALIRQHWAAGINPEWVGRQVIRVSMYANFVRDFSVRVVDIGSWVDSSGALVRYYKLNNTINTELTFTGANGWEDSRISFTFDSDEFVGAATRFALEIQNVDTGDIYIDAVMMHPDFTGSWAQLYKNGPRSESMESLGDSWSNTGALDPTDPGYIGPSGGDCNLHVAETEPVDTLKLWFW